MKRLYLYVTQAVRLQPDRLDIRSGLSWAFAGSGDEISERAWKHVRSSFPADAGFTDHHIMIATLDDPSVDELVRARLLLATETQGVDA